MGVPVRPWHTRHHTLVLCHGGPGLWDMFDDMAGMLNDRATVVRWDQRGCGRSEPCAGPWTSGRFVADLDAVRRHFALERIALLGHSWGASLALNYALAHPERVAALIYVSGTGIGPDADWHGAYEANLLARLGEAPNGSPAGGSCRRRAASGRCSSGRPSSWTGNGRSSTPSTWPTPGSPSTPPATKP